MAHSNTDFDVLGAVSDIMRDVDYESFVPGTDRDGELHNRFEELANVVRATLCVLTPAQLAAIKIGVRGG